jgi:membrane-associated phospholipid phosphatase
MTSPTPGVDSFGDAIRRFDEAADAVLEPWRGNALLGRLMPIATDVGEFSAVWHASSLVRGLVKGRSDQVVALAIGIGLESLLVNQGIKRLFRRERPTTGGDDRFAIRSPLTSAFPSGHASAAAFAATVLIGWDGRRWAPLWGTIAATVALSRPFVRIHHASDVVGGVAVGLTLGLTARRIFTRLGLD